VGYRSQLVRSILRLLLAGTLGLATAFVIACGSSGRGLISSADAGPLKTDFDNVASAVSAGDCGATRTALDQARSDLNNLPPTVDPRVRDKLARGLANLDRNARGQCRQNRTQPTSTVTAPTSTQTTPSTQTTAPPPTSTQAPPPSTAPTTTQTTTTGGSGDGGTPAPGGGGGNGGNGGNGIGGGTPGQ
jgi:hypothetical protein